MMKIFLKNQEGPRLKLFSLTKVLISGVVFMLVPMLGMATNYYVSSTAQYKSDSNAGTSLDLPWATMGKVNGLTFNPGDTVRFYGTITDHLMYDPGNGTQAAPIVLMGMEPNNGRAVISGITLSNTQYVEFQNFEIATHRISINTVNTSTNPVKFLKFKNLYLHDGIQGVAITIPTATDITFENTIIDQMDQDGILLSDAAGDRFSYIGGSITNTGQVLPTWHVHGCYASGGTGHLFDGVTFRNNVSGCAISIRRGGITIRNCQFFDIAYTQYIGNVNEDEATGINHFTGSRAKNQYYMIYRNLFVGGEAIYQSDKLNNGTDLGVDDPGNVWAVFNNTFVNSGTNFSGTVLTNYSKYYDIYMRNNVFVNSTIKVGDANPDKNHVLSNNGWFGSTYNGTTTFPGTGNLTTTPSLDAEYNVTANAYKDAGTSAIAPVRTDKDMLAVSMVTDVTNPLYYLGSNPDIGLNEYGISNIIPTAVINSITPSPATQGSTVSFTGTGTDTDGTIAAYEWSSSINGIFSTSQSPRYSGLSVGTHTISFRVKDNDDAWSTYATRTLVVNAAATYPDLVGFWQLNESTGSTVYDSTVCVNNGTITGATHVAGKKNMGLYFTTATTNYVEIPSSASLNAITSAITLSAWVKASANTASSNIIERWIYGTGVNQRAYCLYVTGTGVIAFGLSNDGTSANVKWLTTTATITRNVWTHIAATFDGTTMKIYINGALSTSVAAGFSTIFVPTGDVHIGNWQATATTWANPFIGSIDEVRLYKKALSASEILGIYNNPANLVADLKFNENAGTIATDNSGNINTGALTNSPTWATGKIGSALNFTNNYVNIPSSTSLNTITSAITLSTWIKASPNTANSTIIDRWLYGTGVNQRAFILYVGANGTISFGLSNDGTSTNAKWLTTTATITRDVWTYITVSFDGTTMKIYINGSLSTSVAAGFSTIFVPTGNVHIGKWQTTATTWELPFIGAIDEVKVYNKSLSLSEIQTLYGLTRSAVFADDNQDKPANKQSISTKCYPNPFSSEITISYNVPEDGKVKIEIYNSIGQLVRKVVDENLTAGEYSTVWNIESSNAGELANGLYICKLVINGKATASKIMLVK